MRLHVLSDVHLEFGDYTPKETGADVVILAGDIHQGHQGIQWAKRHFPKQPIICVMGNHEFYGCDMRPLLEGCRAETRRGNISLLENQSVQIGGITFLGCTLWTDFKLWPKPAEAMEAASDYLADFKVIRTSSGRLRPADTVQIHQASVAWLKSQLKQNSPEKTVIITHHAPSSRSIPPQNAGDIMSAGVHTLGFGAAHSRQPCFALDSTAIRITMWITKSGPREFIAISAAIPMRDWSALIPRKSSNFYE